MSKPLIINTRKILDGTFGTSFSSPALTVSPSNTQTTPTNTPPAIQPTPTTTPPTPALQTTPSTTPVTTDARVKIIRYLDDGRQTLGVMQVYDANGKEMFELESLELPWRNNESGISCIPPGTYTVQQLSNYASYGNCFFVIGNPTYPKKGDPVPNVRLDMLASRYYDSNTMKWKKTKKGYLYDFTPGIENLRTSVMIHAAKGSYNLMGCIAPGESFDQNTRAKLVKKPNWAAKHLGGNQAGNPRGVINSKKALERLFTATPKKFKMVIENSPNLVAQASPSELTALGVPPTIGT